MEANMAIVGLSKQTIPETSSYLGNGEFTAAAGDVVKLEKTGGEYITAEVPAGETWTVKYSVHVSVS